MKNNPAGASPNTELNKLIREAKAGSQKAFEELLCRYAPLLDSMTARYLTGELSGQDREDLHQEAVLGFYRALMRYDLDQDKVQFGLFAKECIRNGLISSLRVLKRQAQILLLDDDPSSDAQAPSSDNPASRIMEEEAYRQLYGQIRRQLSPYENRIWWLYLSGRTAKEIAALVEKDERSVQNAIYRIRKKLRATIPNT